MRTQYEQRTTRDTTYKRLALASGAVIATLAVFITPTAMAADVVVEQQFLTASQARTSDGEALYDELCAVCHGQAGKGDGPAVAALRQTPVDLTVLQTANDGEFPTEALVEIIYGKKRIAAHETQDMPIWGRAFEYTQPDASRHGRIKFAKTKIHSIVEYIESLQVEPSESLAKLEGSE